MIKGATETLTTESNSKKKATGKRGALTVTASVDKVPRVPNEQTVPINHMVHPRYTEEEQGGRSQVSQK